MQASRRRIRATFHVERLSGARLCFCGGGGLILGLCFTWNGFRGRGRIFGGGSLILGLCFTWNCPKRGVSRPKSRASARETVRVDRGVVELYGF